MEKMYQDYRDIAEFRLVYIREAHAADSQRPTSFASQKGINEHTSYEDRCATAAMLIKDNRLTIPTLIDGMDNAVNQAYEAYPDRIFLVRSDGRLAIAADRGPRGFEPALGETLQWLEEFRRTGVEPKTGDERSKAVDERDPGRADQDGGAADGK
jgi:hypothetical protein